MATATARMTLTGPQKCAVLCLALGRERAARVLQQLAPHEVERVTREIASMKSVGAEVVQAVLREFETAAHALEAAARGGAEVAQQVLEQAFGTAEARAVLQRAQGRPQESGLQSLGKAAPEVLAGILRGEHPQTIALILSHIGDRQAAAVLRTMDPAEAAEVLYRVARMEKISPDMLALIELGLSSKADLTVTTEMTASGGPGAVAKLLNLSGATLEKQLLEGIERRDLGMAHEIRSLMFTLEDLLLVDGRGMQRILREVEGKDLALAIKAASEDLRRHIKSNLSERAAAALDEEVEMLGPVRVKDVEAVHTRIIETVRRLEEAGEIVIRGRGEQDDLIA